MRHLNKIPFTEHINCRLPLIPHLPTLRIPNFQIALPSACFVIYGPRPLSCPRHARSSKGRPICIMTTTPHRLNLLTFTIFAGIPGMPFATPAPVPRMGMDPSSSASVGPPGQRDPNIKADLENSELWSQFNEVGTEMIITKTGR